MSLCFVFGLYFALVAFVPTASTLGCFLWTYQLLLREVGGIILILFGLHLTALLKLPLLYWQKHVDYRPSRPSYPASLLIGLIFAIGWTPCVGLILGPILGLAANAATLQQGVILLLFYSLGLGLPFLLLGLGLDQLSRLLKWLKPHGWKTALIEREHVGGTCVNEGCTPTKTMVASARVAYLARRGADYGVHNGPVTVEMTRVRQRKRDIVDSFRNGSQRRIESTEGVDLLMGEASFTGTKVLEVRLNNGEIRQLTANAIFLNTGDRPTKPAVDGLETISTLDSTSIMELDTVPEHLLVLGGGYVGLEFGQMVRRFGSQVTIVQRGAQLLAREDGDVAEEVAKILREGGTDGLLEASAPHAEQEASGKIHLT